jgi:hypothetical protein
MLARGFSAQQGKPPIRDPGLSQNGARRRFMNNNLQEPRSAK